MTPSRWGFAEILTNVIFLLQLATIPLIPYLPTLYYISVFLFWRLSYNLGIAAILYFQSRQQLFTKSVSGLPPDALSLANWFSTKSMSKPYKWSTSPKAFNAWLVFRSICTVILANDGCSYFVLCIACFNSLQNASVIAIVLSALFAVPLFVLSFWSKAVAHKTLGDFAWFWGDFFFTIEVDLVFNGIFAIVPHPMYTIGYAGYYGAALLCRSYTLLFVSLIAHILQIAFLILIEEPHMKIIYSPNLAGEDNSDSEKAPDNPALRLFDQAAPHVSVVIMLLISLISFLMLLDLSNPSMLVTFAVTLAFRLAHWQLMAYFLASPTHADNRWITMLRAHGTSHSRIFAAWQHAMLASTMFNHALFVACAIAVPGTAFSIFSIRTWAHVLGGISLMAISGFATWSSWKATGPFGFYYGDFFVQSARESPIYEGVFKYVNHPDAGIGYLMYYGIACFRQSMSLFVIAFICQLIHKAFVSGFEKRHIEQEYVDVRAESPWLSAVRQLPGMNAVVGQCEERWVMVSTLMMKHVTTQMETACQLAGVRAERLAADAEKRLTKGAEMASRRGNEVKERVMNKAKGMSCASLITKLTKYGMVIDKVEITSDSD